MIAEENMKIREIETNFNERELVNTIPLEEDEKFCEKYRHAIHNLEKQKRCLRNEMMRVSFELYYIFENFTFEFA